MGQRSYTAEYRANAVALAKEMGGSGAARQLKIPADTLYTWMARVSKVAPTTKRRFIPSYVTKSLANTQSIRCVFCIV
jgi:transposase-like protein